MVLKKSKFKRLICCGCLSYFYPGRFFHCDLYFIMIANSILRGCSAVKSKYRLIPSVGKVNLKFILTLFPIWIHPSYQFWVNKIEIIFILNFDSPTLKSILVLTKIVIELCPSALLKKLFKVLSWGYN